MADIRHLERVVAGFAITLRTPQLRDVHLKETGNWEAQSQLMSESGDDQQRLADAAHNQERFNEWVTDAKLSEDVRNRIAVAGEKISRGSFGKFYLLATNDSKPASDDLASSNMRRAAANDTEFESPSASKSRQGTVRTQRS